MESSHQQPQAPSDHQEVGSGKGYLCKQANTRWTPTSDQIRILRELYYNNGVRSPSADQIQKISSKLRQYGKVEGKNVFYWFQNHKARQRQKNRLTAAAPTTTTDHLLLHQTHHHHQNVPIPTMPMQNRGSSWPPLKPDHHHLHHHHHQEYHNNGVSSSSSSGVLGVGQMASFGAYGPVTMEKSFRDCSISSAGGVNFNGFAGEHPYHTSSSPYGSRSRSSAKEGFECEHHQEEDDEDDNGEEQRLSPPGIETLPLFPMRGEDVIINGFRAFKSEPDCGYRGYYHDTNGRTSLELSLCSFTGRFHDNSA